MNPYHRLEKFLLIMIVALLLAICVGGCTSMTASQKAAFTGGANSLQQIGDATDQTIDTFPAGVIPAADVKAADLARADLDKIVPQFDADIQAGTYDPAIAAEIALDAAQIAAVLGNNPPLAAKVSPADRLTVERWAASASSH